MPSATPASSPLRLPAWLWLLTVVLITLNLRPFLTAPGPLGHAIQTATDMGLRMFSWLTLLPMVLMGIGTWLAPAALQRLGARQALLWALTAIGLGCALRLSGTSATLLIATAGLCGAGVALAQGILPGLIKRQSPGRIALMMGVYSAALMGGGALGAQLSPLAMQWGLDWTAALAMWALPVLVTLPLAWWVLGQIPSLPGQTTGPRPTGSATASSATPPSDTHWLVLSFGLMNGGYASTVAWLAPFYQTHGWSGTESGSLLALLSIAQAAAALAIPALAARSNDRRPWIVVTLVLQAVGFTGLAWWPDASPTLNALVLGAGLGGCFALYMLVALDHLPSPTQAGALNALMQGGGFILCALAPWLLAQLHQASGSWVMGWLYQAAVALLVALLVLRFNPRHYAQVMQAPGH